MAACQQNNFSSRLSVRFIFIYIYLILVEQLFGVINISTYVFKPELLFTNYLQNILVTKAFFSF